MDRQISGPPPLDGQSEIDGMGSHLLKYNVRQMEFCLSLDRYLKRLVAKHLPTPLTHGNPMVLNGYALISISNDKSFRTPSKGTYPAKRTYEKTPNDQISHC